MNKKLRNATLITMASGLAYMAFFGPSGQRCEEPIVPANLAMLESIAAEAMLRRPSELELIGLQKDVSELSFQNSRMTQKKTGPGEPVDHPIDLATRFLYADLSR